MMILAIDPGTHCGWALLDSATGAYLSGVWDLGARRHEGGGMRFLRLRSYLTEALDCTSIGMVAYEEVRRHLGTDAAHIYGGIVAVITGECESRGIPYCGVPVAAVKKLAASHGNASKQEMVAAALARWPGWAPESDDEADARWIAEAAAAELGFPAGKTCGRPGLAPRSPLDAEEE